MGSPQRLHAAALALALVGSVGACGAFGAAGDDASPPLPAAGDGGSALDGADRPDAPIGSGPADLDGGGDGSPGGRAFCDGVPPNVLCEDFDPEIDPSWTPVRKSVTMTVDSELALSLPQSLYVKGEPNASSVVGLYKREVGGAAHGGSFQCDLYLGQPPSAGAVQFATLAFDSLTFDLLISGEDFVLRHPGGGTNSATVPGIARTWVHVVLDVVWRSDNQSVHAEATITPPGGARVAPFGGDDPLGRAGTTATVSVGGVVSEAAPVTDPFELRIDNVLFQPRP